MNPNQIEPELRSLFDQARFTEKETHNNSPLDNRLFASPGRPKTTKAPRRARGFLRVALDGGSGLHRFGGLVIGLRAAPLLPQEGEGAGNEDRGVGADDHTDHEHEGESAKHLTPGEE